jgi:hypothetical protein
MKFPIYKDHFSVRHQARDFPFIRKKKMFISMLKCVNIDSALKIMLLVAILMVKRDYSYLGIGAWLLYIAG